MGEFPTVGDVARLMEQLAPEELKMDWDNVGLQLGERSRKVQKILVTLTVTPEVAELAAGQGVDLIVAHHPLIFKPLYHVRTDTYQGALVAFLIRNGIYVYVSHTNLDIAEQGLNHWLAEALGLERPEPLLPGPIPGTGLGRIGKISPGKAEALCDHVQAVLDSPVRLVGPRGLVCEKVAVCGGSGGDLVSAAAEVGAQALVTGDVSYHEALDAVHAGLVVIDAGHHGTEKIMVPKVAAYLRGEMPGVEILEAPGLDPFTGCNLQ
ncbi:MAG TPA: Nif3-like dinuclear metal center hexameric protein [Firmicutes bacterium]|jgi:dinuclear metal center YbgI/SA1388 family protein|nr:MAG: hypothetical protein AA931_02300 [Peptococcaceae bacterium 1109]HHT72658.1 Nif3-like dinuclear metal center hexameric protein [Bacillota bacterium]